MAITTSRGLDVSAYQGAQDWTTLVRSGLTFAFAKASEGQHSRDARFAGHITGIIAAGLVPGAYHYGWPSQDPAAEAANYTDAVQPYARRGFVHILDLERRSDGANYGGQSSAQIRAWAEAWIARVRAAHPGQRVLVYTSASDIAAGRMPRTADGLWYPAYPAGAMSYAQAEARARPAPSGLQPLIWQFTSTPIDRSIAYLAPDALRAWAAGDTAPQEDPMPTADEIATAVVNKLVGASVDDPTTSDNSTTTYRGLWWTAGMHAGRADANSAKAVAQIAALTAAVAALAKGGGLTAAEITTAAQAGATAALDQLGTALTNVPKGN